tara:strand:- start:1114 stop:1500 length:387 start_codon:yes stop_codon:yes gene_type:complete
LIDFSRTDGFVGRNFMLEELLLPCKSTSQAAAAEELQHHHRQLLVPAAVVDTPIPTDVVAWASVLCCVFTHVIVIADTEIDAAAACDSAYDIPPARLIDYDGSVRCFPEQVPADSKPQTRVAIATDRT